MRNYKCDAMTAAAYSHIGINKREEFEKYLLENVETVIQNKNFSQ